MKRKVFLVQYKLPNILKFGSVRFMPGINKITQEQWDEIKDHPLLPFRFEEDHLEWLKGKGPDDCVDEEEGVESEGEEIEEKELSEMANDVLSEYKPKEAKDLVKNTFDVDLLKSWKETEERGAVLKVIDQQIEKLEEPEAE